MYPTHQEKRSRQFSRLARALLLGVISSALTACELGGGFEVGPFPISIDLAPQSIDPRASFAASLNVSLPGIVIPLCDLPTREEAEELLVSQAGPNVAPFVSLARAEIRAIVLFVETGVLKNASVGNLYYAASVQDVLLEGPIFIGEASVTEDMVEVVPVDSFDLLALIDDKEAGSQGACPFVFLTFQGALPNEPFTLEGHILADVYGRVGLGGS